MHLIPPIEAYRAAFTSARAREFPPVSAHEAQLGYAIDRDRLEGAARVLACPVKAHPPNWQHGRVIYAEARRWFAQARAPLSLVEPVLLDIGTAKGFSALCLEWARRDARALGRVVSVDVIAPASQVRRNSIADCERLHSLAELLAPWPEASAIDFRHETGIDYLTRTSGPIGFAFVDGKHEREIVRQEGQLLAARQAPGDVAIFDDAQLPPVSAALHELRRLYAFTTIEPEPWRRYAIGIRR